MRRSVVIATIASVAGALVVGGVGIAVAAPTVSGAGASVASPVETVAAPPTDEQAVAFLRADTADFPQLDNVFVQRSTVAGVESILGGDSLPYGYAGDLPVILVTGTGAFHPSYEVTGNLSFSWGTMVIDATDGGLIGTFALPGDVPSALLARG